jgi:class 3 adenylate cyclase
MGSNKKITAKNRLGARGRRPETQVAAATTIHVRCVFLDIARFTLNRSVEAQANLVKVLNRIVRAALKDLRIKDKILLPTGDGMCVAINTPSDLDIHVRLALKVLALLAGHNKREKDSARQFDLRVGINENDDNLVIDINGRRNIAGAGINIAQRVMSAADGNQILVGQPVFEVLRHRERYMNSFRSFSARTKHGVSVPVHQLVIDAGGLNIAIPSQFRQEIPEEVRLTRQSAYYVAHAIRLHAFLAKLDRHGSTGYSSKVLLWYLAKDSAGASLSSDTTPYRPKTWGIGKASVEEQFRYYDSRDFWVTCDLSEYITGELRDYSACFETQPVFNRQFVTQFGRKKLKTEFPDIWDEFELDKAKK